MCVCCKHVERGDFFRRETFRNITYKKNLWGFYENINEQQKEIGFGQSLGGKQLKEQNG